MQNSCDFRKKTVQMPIRNILVCREHNLEIYCFVENTIWKYTSLSRTQFGNILLCREHNLEIYCFVENTIWKYTVLSRTHFGNILVCREHKLEIYWFVENTIWKYTGLSRTQFGNLCKDLKIKLCSLQNVIWSLIKEAYVVQLLCLVAMEY